MRFRALAFAATVAAPTMLLAQHTTPAPGRVAGIAPPPATVNVPPNLTQIAPGTVFYGNIPVIAFADGRVYADFGRGFEQVVRSCSLPVNYPIPGSSSSPLVQPSVVQPTVAQPAIVASPQPLPYTPAVPAQQTASQQMATGTVQPAQAAQQTLASQSCWAMGTAGRIFIGHP